MAGSQYKRRRQIREARLEIVASLYKKGYSFRKIRSEVMARLDLKTLSTGTVKKDVDYLLTEWRSQRIEDMELAIQLQLEKIDDRNRELWEQWEKSKQDGSKRTIHKRGAPKGNGDGGGDIKPVSVEMTESQIIALGDVSYLAEIRANEEQRIKLLGLNAPDKKDFTISSTELIVDKIENKLTEDEKNLLLKIGETVLDDKDC